MDSEDDLDDKFERYMYFDLEDSSHGCSKRSDSPVLARPVFDVSAFKTDHVQTIIKQVKSCRSPSYCSSVQNLDYPKYGTSIIQTLWLGPSNCVYPYVNKQPQLFELSIIPKTSPQCLHIHLYEYVNKQSRLFEISIIQTLLSGSR